MFCKKRCYKTYFEENQEITFNETTRTAILKTIEHILLKIAYFVWQWMWFTWRVVASDVRGQWFVSSHWQIFIEHLFPINCIEKTNIKQKRPGIAQF